jgi:hypothetical protein
MVLAGMKLYMHAYDYVKTHDFDKIRYLHVYALYMINILCMLLFYYLPITDKSLLLLFNTCNLSILTLITINFYVISDVYDRTVLITTGCMVIFTLGISVVFYYYIDNNLSLISSMIVNIPCLIINYIKFVVNIKKAKTVGIYNNVACVVFISSLILNILFIFYIYYLIKYPDNVYHLYINLFQLLLNIIWATSQVIILDKIYITDFKDLFKNVFTRTDPYEDFVDESSDSDDLSAGITPSNSEA